MCLTCQTTEKDPRQESLNWQSYGERLAKEAFWSPATRGSRKDFDRAITPVAEAVCVTAQTCPCTLGPVRVPASQAADHLHAQLSPGQSCHRQKKVWPLCAQGHFGSVQLCDPVDWPARLPCQGGGFYRQEYWSVLPITGCHDLLECYISYCPSRQLPWIPDAVRTPVTQTAAPPPHLAFTGAKPSAPRQPQEQTPVDDPHAQVEIKPQLKPRGSVAKEEYPKPSQQHTSWRLNP